ncbi:MAG: T9SS type A sorting domain-containing protein [Fidelibacterota bacterium]
MFKSYDQKLSPDEILYFTVGLRIKDNTFETVEIIPEYRFDKYLREYYPSDYINNDIKIISLKQQSYYKTSDKIYIPSYTPSGHILTIPYKFVSENQIVGRDTLSFTIQGNDSIPPFILNPMVSNTYLNSGEKIRIWAIVIETGDIHKVMVNLKNSQNESVLRSVMMKDHNYIYYHYYYYDYTPEPNSDYYIDVYAEDMAGNIGNRINGDRFTTKPHQIENDILVVYTYRTPFLERYLHRASPITSALEKSNYNFDIWDPYLRYSAVDSTILKQYDKVIFATDYFPEAYIPHLTAFLNNNGKLLIAERAAEFSRIMQTTDFFRDYMCARYLGPATYKSVEGVYGNRISERLDIELLDSEDFPSEAIAPVSPAQPLLKFDTERARQSLGKPVSQKDQPDDLSVDSLLFSNNDYENWQDESEYTELIKNTSLGKGNHFNSNSTPLAAIAVDSTYKLVFLGFPFEAIADSVDRAALMGQIMAWFDEENNDNNNKLFKFKLSQNYPNPFNPVTTIEYSLVKPGTVNLTVYNIKGERVKNLVNEKQAIGSYRVKWTPEELSAGIYFYRLQTDHYTKVKKCTFIK